MEAQWLRLHTSNVRGEVSLPVWGTKILLAAWCSQKKKDVFISPRSMIILMLKSAIVAKNLIVKKEKKN